MGDSLFVIVSTCATILIIYIWLKVVGFLKHKDTLRVYKNDKKDIRSNIDAIGIIELIRINNERRKRK